LGRLLVSLANSRRDLPARAGCSSRAADRKNRCSRGMLASGQARRGCLAPAVPAQAVVGQGGGGHQRNGRVPRSRTQPEISSGLRASNSPAAIRIPTRQLRPAAQRGRHNKSLFVTWILYLPTMHMQNELYWRCYTPRYVAAHRSRLLRLDRRLRASGSFTSLQPHRQPPMPARLGPSSKIG
jgi:hypothetical protein